MGPGGSRSFPPLLELPSQAQRQEPSREALLKPLRTLRIQKYQNPPLLLFISHMQEKKYTSHPKKSALFTKISTNCEVCACAGL